MKTLLTISTLVFTLVFSSSSFAEWTKVTASNDGTMYVDFERIREHDGYVYYWRLDDHLKPNKYGRLSEELYVQADCKLFRQKFLYVTHHKEPMGRGTPFVSDNTPDKDWRYPSPNTLAETTLKSVCERPVIF